MSRMKFVAGDEQGPRTFAQRVFHRLEEEQPLETNTRGKMFFCAGEQTPEDVIAPVRQQKEVKSASSPQSAGEQAEKIYAQMQALDGLYENLQRLNAQTRDDFQELRQELQVVTFAMGRIAQSLSRSRRPYPPERPPLFNDFCQGLRVTNRYLRDILWNLRVLMRTTQNQNTNLQLFIIYTTLSSQRQEIAEMQTSCK